MLGLAHIGGKPQTNHSTLSSQVTRGARAAARPRPDQRLHGRGGGGVLPRDAAREAFRWLDMGGLLGRVQGQSRQLLDLSPFRNRSCDLLF